MGSKPRGAARAMYTGLAEVGAEIQVHDFRDNLGRVDHRKLYVIDGKVAWTGGAGIEDHFNDGRFHDVMVRVTGDVVRQAQAAFLDSFRGHGGALPTDLARCFPEPEDPGSVPVVLTQVLPGGFVAASHAIGEQIEQARERLDVMNPYFTDRDMVERILAAAGRGVKVRVVVSEVSNNHSATAALKHRYGDLFAAGVEVWELPGTVVHAKVIVADDVVSFGTVNLDAWALYRNSEIMLTARSAELAALMEERLFEPDIARCTRGEPPSEPRDRLKSWLADKLTYYL
jgi:cardiolipin synthase A/B